VQPDELRVVPLPRRRDQDIYLVRDGLADVVAAQRGRPGDQAVLARVQQRGHFLLERGRCSRRGQVDTRQQFVPRAAGSEPVGECVPGQAGAQRLPTGDEVKLLAQDPVERIPVESGRWGHADMMPTVSDKRPRVNPQADQKVRMSRK
jgi:hypothetical protein